MHRGRPIRSHAHPSAFRSALASSRRVLIGSFQAARASSHPPARPPPRDIRGKGAGIVPQRIPMLNLRTGAGECPPDVRPSVHGPSDEHRLARLYK